MKQLFIILVLFVTYLGGSKTSLAQGFPGVECLNCCAVIGQGQNQCRVVCTEQKYILNFFTGAISGPCVFPAQSGVTATLVSSGNGICTFEVVFTAPGTYNIQGTCFKVLAHPTAIITNSNPITACKGPVDFYNGSLNATDYLWDFGDPASGPLNTSTLPGNPVTHVYNTAGTYTVTLIASVSITTAGGEHECCRDTTQITVIVDSASGPLVECLSPVCENTSGTYCITSNPGCTYTWSTNAGNTVTPAGNCATFTWNTVPLGQIILTPSGANCCPYPTTFTIPIMPASTFTINGNANVCAGSIQLYNAPVIWGATYNWSISPALNFTIPNPANPSQIAVQWPASGTFTITCNMGNDVLDCDATGTITVTVQPSFDLAGPAEVCVGQAVTFTSTATGTVWSATTGCTPSGNNFNCNFSTPGTYTISATAPGYCNNPTITVLVHPQPASPVVSGPVQVLPGCTYTYSVTGTGPITWNVLPGTATVVNAGNSIHVTWPSNFTSGSVIASVVSNNCPSVPDTLNVGLVPASTISPAPNVCSNGQTSYNLSSLPANTTVQWTISPASAGSVTAGQGTSGITVSWYTVGANTPVTITATITNSCTGNTFVAPFTTSTLFPEPSASISGNIIFCVGSSTVITATAGFSGYAWDGVSTGLNTHSFNTPGQHSVEVTDANSCKKKIFFTLVQIPAPVVTLSTTTAPSCTNGQLNNFTLATTVGAGFPVSNYTFTGPGNSPLCNGLASTCAVSNPQPGTYTVAVTFNFTYNGNPVSCTKTVSINVACPGGGGNGGCTKNPNNCQYTFAYTYITCNTIQLTITPAVGCSTGYNMPDNILLDWGDGNSSNIFGSWVGSSYVITHTYSLPSYYHLSLECGLGNVSIPVGGAVDFDLVHNGCAIDLLDFSSAISGATFTFVSVDWEDGNVNASTTHNYANTGFYTVTLNYTLNGSPCSATDTITFIKPDFNILANPNPACAGAPVNFSASLTSPFTAGNIASYEWIFGDASANSHDSAVAHSYTNPGTYTVILNIEDIYGCTRSDTISLVVNPPVAYTITTNSPQCDSVILTINTPSGFGNPTSVAWTPASVNNLGGFQYSADSSGLFTAVITGPNGCAVTVSKNIIVFRAPNIQIFAPDSTCTGVTDTITTDASPAQFTFNWQINGLNVVFNQSGTSSNIAFSPIAAGSYEVSLTATSVSAPNCSVTIKDTIEVFDSPQLTVSSNATGVVCFGTPVVLTGAATGGTPGYSYSWSNAIVGNPITVFNNGIYTITVTDTNNCTAQASINANISPLPDFTVFARGCDTLCYGKMDTIHGPAGYTNYQFLIDNVTVQNGAGSFLADPCGFPAMAGGGPHIIKLIITTGAGCIDSAQFELSCKECIKCVCDSTIYFSSSPYVISQPDPVLGAITDSSKCGSGTPMTLDCNKPYRFAIDFHVPPGKDTSCQIVDSAVLTDVGGNVLATVVGLTPNNPLPYTFTQSGTYCITYYLKVNGVVCKVCRMCVTVSCPVPPLCATCPSMMNFLRFELDTLMPKPGYQIQTGSLSFTTLTSFQEVNISIADISYSWSDTNCKKCNVNTITRGCLFANSTTQTIGSLVLDSNGTKYLPLGNYPNDCPGEVSWVMGMAATANSYNVPLQISLPPGLIPSCCSLSLDKLCLRVRIKDLNCQVCDTVICYEKRPPCCKGGKWLTKKVNWTTPSSPGVPAVTNTINVACGQTYNITAGTSYNFNSTYQCATGTGCGQQLKVRVKNPNGSSSLQNMPQSKTFNNPGLYTITYYAYCGTSICDSCVFYLDVKKDCCDKSGWTSKTIKIKKANGQFQTKNLTNGTTHTSADTATVTLAFKCNEECTATYQWKRWRNGAELDSAMITTTTASTILKFKPPTSSCDSIVITAYCDGKPCATLSFKLCCLACAIPTGIGRHMNYELRKTSYELRIASCDLRVLSDELRMTSEFGL